MKRMLRKLTTFSAVAAAALGMAVVPASQAQADAPLHCPFVYTVCTWTGPGGSGQLRPLFADDGFIPYGVQSAQNRTAYPWCFFEGMGFRGIHHQLDQGETVRRLEFTAHSVYPGQCPL
ncbi:peptidase inhibitor family I36 protein [Streptomyces halobius]|uniref:Peptidase inhibitor family I36 protein n=1 Tax=Streptomyces halobius TaxID=2879846 RepID=A0ABY4MDJ8_9ACTN|nr:peptidase inhibitor family I36 protein [Streptomyces halobius]UQA94480.1 peptidase inhibitor family I36 protein [Streptomyces halobius]